MHQITGNRDEVLRILKQTALHLSRDKSSTKTPAKKTLRIKTDYEWASVRDTVVGDLQRAYRRALEQPAINKTKGFASGIPQEAWYAPRDQTIALVQSAMDEYLDGPAKNPSRLQKGSKASGTAKQAIIGEEFDIVDPGWIEVVIQKLKVRWEGKHKFISHHKKDDFRFNLDENARIAIVGDWGGGNAAALAVASQIRSARPDHVIHLGDVYYSGTEKEIRERFLKYWKFWGNTPAVPGRSFALNSNHEMYSGGYGYFDVTLKEFKQPASYFSLSNEHWQFIGLDTGYVDHNLNKEQVEWLSSQLGNGPQKNILLTHHQLFSAYEFVDDTLETWVKPFLDANQIYGWFWGHEHLELLYDTYKGVKARCLGNGCFPYELPSIQIDHNVPVPQINKTRQLRQASKGIHSFALLVLNGAKMTIEYIDQYGGRHSEEF